MTTENLHSLCLLWFHLCLCAVVISKLWLNWNERLTGVLEEDESYWGGKIRGREIGCRALKNSTQTSSADNKSEPEQLFVLAEVTLKLAHLPLTVGAPCILPDTIVFNIPKVCPPPSPGIAFNNWWKKWVFFFFLLGALVKHRVCVDGVKGSGRVNECLVWSSSPGYGRLWMWK